MRRSQSLKSLSGLHEDSWVQSALTLRDRKSVLQLVQQYQSFGDLRASEKAEHKHQVPAVGRRWESRENIDTLGSGRGLPLSRCRSMDCLPQREASSTSALRALFESKAARQQDFPSSPRPRSSSAMSSKTAQECRPVAWRGHSTPMQDKTTEVERQNNGSGLMDSHARASRYSHADRQRGALTETHTESNNTGAARDNIGASSNTEPRTESYHQATADYAKKHFYDRRSPQSTYGDAQTRPGRDRSVGSGSVKDRSALYLSRVSAKDSTGGSTQPEFIGASGQRAKSSKMANVTRKITVSDTSHDEDDLPLPPPPLVPTRPLDYEGPSSPIGLPMPPPKESFSAFYQQRQKSELKRLFKHIHPEMRANLDDVVDDELVETMQSEITQAADAGYHGEVQSMRWIFENWTLDNIGDPHATKKLLHEEDLKGGDVRGTSSMFEHIDSTQPTSGAFIQRQPSIRGDVRTSTWLFETQPMDALNKLRRDEGELVEAVLKEPIERGDVRGARLLFESKSLSNLGRCDSIEDHSFLKLKSELQEQKGGVEKTVKLFQTEPCCAIADKSGNIHEIKSICREEIRSDNISTARWLFETQPLDIINKGTDGVKIIRGISLEEGQSGGVARKKWLFETQPFNTIQEGMEVPKFEATLASCTGEADVENKRKLFETQPLAALKGDSTETEMALEKEQILGGDVKTSLWLFETQPMESLNDSCEVGHLKNITLSADEQGAVKGTKQIFENYRGEKSTEVRQEEIEKGDVKLFKHLFETIPLSKITHSDEELNQSMVGIATAGNVKGNKALFETIPLYAIKDCSGNLHEVKTVSREEHIKGNVQNYKWLFETKPFDQFVEIKGNVEVIKGITRQEDTMGDVKMAKWLFETQTIDDIHSKFNQTDQSSSVEEEESRKGDVKTCKWLFETQPMDILYEKSDKVPDKEAIENTNVKSFTWLFESQPLDSIKDSEEHKLKLCDTVQDTIKSEVGVKTVKHLFETETLDRIRKDTSTDQDVTYVSQVDVQSGDVSRVKELFESQSLDEIGSETTTSTGEDNQGDHIQGGAVHKFTWLFENCPINTINDKDTNEADMHRVSDIEGGDVHNKKFIFETFSLDKIHDQPLEMESICVEKHVSNVDVKSSTMMFESQPLYAIRDKEGQFHEVTTVKKEEVMSGDVRGARWMFETKPLDAIKAENEVYVIRAVTQEDVKKGDVKSARWKFETQPLDSFTSQDEPSVDVVECLGSSNVQLSKEIFESDQSANKKYVRMVSVTDVQQGDVRTSTWLFENQPIDSLKGEPMEQGMVNTVHREDVQKGDVKRCTWLFESQPLDKIKESDDSSVHEVQEEIPKVDVKSTTWLFETTQLDKITVSNVTDTLLYLHQLAYIHSNGIIIEANEIRNVNMAKYQLDSKEGVLIQKEEVIEGNIRKIMLQLLCRPNLKPQITLIREMEKGKVNTTVVELPVDQSTSCINLEEDQRIQNIVDTIDTILIPSKALKRGIIMQESAGGKGEMAIYSLICQSEIKTESPDIERGDVKSTIGNLLATASSQKTATSCRIDETEKVNVNLYKSCIEKGDLQYLKSLQTEASDDDGDPIPLAKDNIEIFQGDVKEAKRSLYEQKEQVERTISDVLPGDVKNTKKFFSSECSHTVENCIPKEDIIRGDISSAKQQLAVKQPVVVEKEEVVAGDIKATLQSLERAKQQSMHMEREVIKPGTIYDMNLSAQTPETEGGQTQKEEIISGDVKAAKKSLEMAKSQSMRVERQVIVPGKIYNLNVSADEQSSSTVTQTTSSSSSRDQQITTTYQKVSDEVKDQETHVTFQACQQHEMTQSTVRANNCTQQSQPPILLKSECDGKTTEEETGAEIVRGDVKAAIRSLQSAAMEQKLPDKEDIIRGNMQLALKSLEKSSVNVSKGDFKAAMIYRNSGRTCSGSSKPDHKQCVMVSMPSSDNELSPSISVTCEEQPSLKTQNTTPDHVTLLNGNSKSSCSEGIAPPPLPQKSREKPMDKRPALPPKPQQIKPTGLNEQYIMPPPSKVLPHSINDCVIKMATDNAAEPAGNISDCQFDKKLTAQNNTEEQMERNVIQKINAAEEIQMCCQTYSEDGRHGINMGFKAALQNFGKSDRSAVDTVPVLSKKTKVNEKVSQEKQTCQTAIQEKSKPQIAKKQQYSDEMQKSVTNNLVESCPVPQQIHAEGETKPENEVVLRKRKVKETEDERRQRLSVHKEEIMKGNVKAAMEIFENLRKREELKIILSQVQEIEGETSNVDVSSLKTLFENVPAWIVSPSRNAGQRNKKGELKVEIETQDDEIESTSSVETAFEDLEKASREIIILKEQTLAKLLDIEEAIKKALYSVSNLKSEADIAGLSGLFDESLKSEQSCHPTNNIRKISIVSSKVKTEQIKETPQVNVKEALASSPSKPEGTPTQVKNKTLIRQSSAPSSPSFISIHSAAKKPTEQYKSLTSTAKSKGDGNSQSHQGNGDLGQTTGAAEFSNNFHNSACPQRKVSVLEVKAIPEPPAGIFGTKTVSETYEETDGFGNTFVSSKTSTFVTKHSESNLSASFEVVGSPARYEVMTSPLMRRSNRPFVENVLTNAKEEGTVFVTFSQPKTEKH
ncbi:xin actin-binding repeat-containing protein 1 [Lampris incognitus]|uniref:xin actin-binding repeat-containing protein 1 n=1 Tax=Lampris incognitus TaxID=2546036 RepID=UPI0024B48CB6|nr:xin actin-binding repeat-containing protein 1 [Lampris incognitus]